MSNLTDVLLLVQKEKVKCLFVIHDSKIVKKVCSPSRSKLESVLLVVYRTFFEIYLEQCTQLRLIGDRPPESCVSF